MANYSGSGAGTETDPYLITTFSELCEIMTCANGLSSYWKLSNDIDAAASSALDGGAGWTPIGTAVDGGLSDSFSGGFDGNNKTISNLFINRPSQSYVGFFGCNNVLTVGEIKNLKLTDVNITGYRLVGGLIGANFAKIKNCSTSGSVKSVWGDVGGLCGDNYCENATIEKCFSSANVSGIGTGGLNSNGGFTGANKGKITQCYATGSVSNGLAATGGFCGHFLVGQIDNCYATGAVSGVSKVGGFCGRIGIADSPPEWQRVAINCYSTGAVTGSNFVGGFSAEWADDVNTVISCYWDTQTSGQATSYRGTGKTTAQMKQQATFVGWNFTEIWTITENVTYPIFGTKDTPLIIKPDFGSTAGGTQVQIIGTGFTGETGCTFGGVAATDFTVVSDTEIVCVTPAHAAGGVDVVIGSQTSSNGFTYGAYSVSPHYGNVLGGTAVTITGIGFTGETEVLFDTTPATEFIVVSDTKITCLTPPHAAGKVDVVIGETTITDGFRFFNSWDFVNIWKIYEGVDYPFLR